MNNLLTITKSKGISGTLTIWVENLEGDEIYFEEPEDYYFYCTIVCVYNKNIEKSCGFVYALK